MLFESKADLPFGRLNPTIGLGGEAFNPHSGQTTNVMARIVI